MKLKAYQIMWLIFLALNIGALVYKFVSGKTMGFFDGFFAAVLFLCAVLEVQKYYERRKK